MLIFYRKSKTQSGSNKVSHTAQYRVYYEDTDAGGVVYHANYLKFAERARTDMLRSLQINQSELRQEQGILFVVRNISIDFIKPAHLDNLLEVRTSVVKMANAKMELLQEIFCDEKRLSSLDVTVVCVNNEFKPTKIPQDIKNAL